MSLRQFAVHMGLYTQEELDTPVFTEGISEFPEGITTHHAWAELGYGPYREPNPKSTGFREPVYRILHRAMAHGISGRGDSASGNVMHYDLFYLHCMIHHRPCQIVERLAIYLFQVRRQKHVQAVFGGGYVTRLARSLGVEIPERPNGPRLISVSRPIDMTVFLSMGVAERKDGGIVLKEIIDPATLIRRGTHDSEAGPSGTAGDGGASSSGAGGADQAHASTQVPISETPAPPPTHTTPAESRPQQTLVYEGGYGARLRRIERIQLLECTEAAAHRAFMTRSIQLLAAGTSPAVTLPEPPVPHQELIDFVSQTGPPYVPDPPQQPPVDP